MKRLNRLAKFSGIIKGALAVIAILGAVGAAFLIRGHAEATVYGPANQVWVGGGAVRLDSTTPCYDTSNNNHAAPCNLGSGDTAAFDPVTGILTLNGYNGASIIVANDWAGAKRDIIIKLVGTNVINHTADGVFSSTATGIDNQTNGNITIASDAPATLSITVVNSWSGCNSSMMGQCDADGIITGHHAPSADGNVTIGGQASVTIDVTATAQSGKSMGICSSGTGTVAIIDDASLAVSPHYDMNGTWAGSKAVGVHNGPGGRVEFNTTGDIRFDIPQQNGSPTDRFSVALLNEDTAYFYKVGSFAIYWQQGGKDFYDIDNVHIDWDRFELSPIVWDAGWANGPGHRILTYLGDPVTPPTTVNTASVVVDRPVAGTSRNMSANPGNPSQYSASVFQWLALPSAAIMNSSDTFVAGTTYQVLVTLTPQTDYVFANPLTVTINGQTATKSLSGDEPANTYWVELVSTDETAPNLFFESASFRTESAYNFSWGTDEPGHAWGLVVASGAAVPTTAQIKAGFNFGGGVISAGSNWSADVTTAAHDIYVIVEDAAGNISAPLKVQAPAYNPPVVSAVTVDRLSNTVGSLNLTTDTAGTLLYLVCEPGALACPWATQGVNVSLGAVSAGDIAGKSIALTAGAKDVFVVVSSASGQYSAPVKVSVPAFIPLLTGVATINNTAPKIGDTLTASLVDGNNTGTLHYAWFANATPVGTDSANYTVVTADLGKYISVVITSSVEREPVTSEPTSAVVKKNAGSATAPSLASRTNTSITLNTVAGHQYRIGSEAWQNSPEFTGLDANTEYVFTLRLAETADTLASSASSPAVLSTLPNALAGTAEISNPNPRIGDVLTADLASDNNTGTLHFQWKADGTNVGADSANYTVQTADLNKTITVVISSSIETGTKTSDATAAVIKKVAGLPVAPALGSSTPNSITLVGEAGHEYSIDGGENWQTSLTFSGLSANTDYAFNSRIAETTDTYASAVSAVRTFRTLPNVLTGTIIVSGGFAKVGTTYTATLNDTNNTGSLTYKWYNDDSELVGTGADYTFTVGDLGKKFRLVVSSSVETGTKEWGWSDEVVKKSAPATVAPVKHSVTDTTVTLEQVAGYEYSIDNGTTWQDSSVFTGLDGLTNYSFVQRFKESADTYEGATSTALTVMTDVPPDVTPPTITASYAWRSSDRTMIDFTTDEAGTLYMIYLPAGSPAPDASALKATEPFIPVDPFSAGFRVLLPDSSAYDVYLTEVDLSVGANTSTVEKVEVPAYDAPVLSAGTINRTSDTTSTIGFNTTKSGEAIYVVYPDSTATPYPWSVAYGAGVGTSLGNVSAGTVSGVSIPLTAGDKRVFVVLIDSNNELSDVLTIDAPAFVPTLTGTTTIDNTAPRIGDILTANFAGTCEGVLSFAWKTGSTVLGTGPTYTAKLSDRGNQITVEASCTSRTGKVASDPTYAVAKKQAGSPVAPVVASRTYESVTLTAVAGYEYTLSTTLSWQDGTVFTGLSPDTTYYFVQRIKETSDTNASTISSQISVTTEAAPDTTPISASLVYYVGGSPISPSTPTNQDVTVTITTNRAVKTPAGWTATDATSRKFAKTYSANATETVVLEDVLEIVTDKSVTVTVANIDKDAPWITITGDAPTNFPAGIPLTHADLIFGLDCEDDFDTDISMENATVIDWGGLDPTDPQPGTYTIVYSLYDDTGNQTTKDRTITINPVPVSIKCLTDSGVTVCLNNAGDSWSEGDTLSVALTPVDDTHHAIVKSVLTDEHEAMDWVYSINIYDARQQVRTITGMPMTITLLDVCHMHVGHVVVHLSELGEGFHAAHPTEIVGGKVVFQTDHLSDYTVAGTPAPTGGDNGDNGDGGNGNTNPNTNNGQTGDSNGANGAAGTPDTGSAGVSGGAKASFAVLAVLSGAGLVLTAKRRLIKRD